MARKDGTDMWCPMCKAVRSCKEISKPYEKRRFYKRGFEDIQYFKRTRECLFCHSEFTTAEVHGNLLDELAVLRKKCSELQEQNNGLNETVTGYRRRVPELRENEKKLRKSLVSLADKFAEVQESAGYLKGEQGS